MTLSYQLCPRGAPLLAVPDQGLRRKTEPQKTRGQLAERAEGGKGLCFKAICLKKQKLSQTNLSKRGSYVKGTISQDHLKTK